MMRKEISWKRVGIIFLSLLLPTLLVIIGYYLWLQPLQNQLVMVQQELQNEEKLLSIVQQKQDEQETTVIGKTTQLQGKVPVAPLVDQFLLDLQKAEVLSDSFIISYGVTTQEENFANKVAEGEATKPKSVEIQNPLDESKEQDQPAQVQSELPVPEGVSKLTVNLSVTSPNYTQMEQFLNRIEKMKRIVNIDSLSFTGKPETIVLNEQQKPEMNYTVQVSTFYAPQLEELITDLPYVPYPKPSQRTNPLSWNEVTDEQKQSSEP